MWVFASMGLGLAHFRFQGGSLSGAAPVYHRWAETFPSDGEGFVGLDVPENMLHDLVIAASIMAVNNGVGTIQDLPGIAGLVWRSVSQRRVAAPWRCGYGSPVGIQVLSLRLREGPVVQRVWTPRFLPSVFFVGRPFPLRLGWVAQASFSSALSRSWARTDSPLWHTTPISPGKTSNTGLSQAESSPWGCIKSSSMLFILASRTSSGVCPS